MAVAILSLALGIGVNGAIFTHVNAIEFRPLPFRQASELVDVSEDSPAELCAGCSAGTSWPTLSLWRTRARSFVALEAYRESHRYVVARGLRLAVLGLVIGLPAAWLLAHGLASVLFTVRPGDPVVFVLVAAALTVVVLLACWIPARRATRVNPVDALRFD